MRRGRNVQLAPGDLRETKPVAIIAGSQTLVGTRASSVAHETVDNGRVALAAVKMSCRKCKMLHCIVNTVNG